VFALAFAVVAGGAALVHAQMGDLRSMSGIPLPVSDMPARSVSVRLVRGDMSNPITNHEVELRVGAEVKRIKTDANGRVQFEALPVGGAAIAAAVIDNQRIESQQFVVPEVGGVRLLLVAGAEVAPGGTSAPGGATPATTPGGATAPPSVPAAPAPGSVAFGGDTRFIVELDDDQLQVFYLLDIVNGSSAPVSVASPLVFDLPDPAQSATLLEGSSTLASVNGRQVTVSGPFPPGRTQVQVAYQLSTGNGSVRIALRVPAAVPQVTVIVQQPGGVRLASPQIAQQREMPSEGRPFIMAGGPGLASGSTLTLELTGLPHRAAAPRTLALVVGLLVIVLGAVAAFRTGPRDGAASERQQLEQRRERIFADLVRVEEQSREGRMDPARYEERRRALMSELERIYGELDTSGASRSDEGLTV
jgi:hypothetical protein